MAKNQSWYLGLAQAKLLVINPEAGNVTHGNDMREDVASKIQYKMILMIYFLALAFNRRA